jgi:hypothetical protein
LAHTRHTRRVLRPFGSVAWSGSLREGNGSVATESQALENYPYIFFIRYGEKPGTNPEELLGAAVRFRGAGQGNRMTGVGAERTLSQYVLNVGSPIFSDSRTG